MDKRLEAVLDMDATVLMAPDLPVEKLMEAVGQMAQKTVEAMKGIAA